MDYATIYDITTQPPLNWRSLVLPFGLAMAAILCFFLTRSQPARYGFIVFAFLVFLVAVIIPFWDYHRLRSKLVTAKDQVAEGVITNHWEKEWTKRRDGKNQHYSYEGFQVGGVSFGYFRNVEMAGFTNTGADSLSFQDGLGVRIHYVPERQIDDGSIINRIVKLEIHKSAQ